MEEVQDDWSASLPALEAQMGINVDSMWWEFEEGVESVGSCDQPAQDTHPQNPEGEGISHPSTTSVPTEAVQSAAGSPDPGTTMTIDGSSRDPQTSPGLELYPHLTSASVSTTTFRR